MKILAVETATSWQSVAILDGEEAVARSDRDAEGSHAKWLLPAIDQALESAALQLSDLDGLAVSIGPGSFTGLRVGLATMLGFRTVTGLPLAVVPTLEAMAWNMRGEILPLCPIVRSRAGEVYWAVYRWTAAGMLETLCEARVGSPEVLSQSIQEKTVVYGDGWRACTKDIRQALGKTVSLLCEAPFGAQAPSAVSVGLAGMMRLAKGEVAGLGVAPLYVQRSEAELNYERHGSVTPLCRMEKRLARRRARTASGSRRSPSAHANAKKPR